MPATRTPGRKSSDAHAAIHAIETVADLSACLDPAETIACLAIGIAVAAQLETGKPISDNARAELLVLIDKVIANTHVEMEGNLPTGMVSVNDIDIIPGNTRGH